MSAIYKGFPPWRGQGRFAWVVVNVERSQSTFDYLITVSSWAYYYKKKISEQIILDEWDIVKQIYLALLAYWFDEEGALKYIDSMKVIGDRKEGKRETPIIRHESDYNPIPTIILWLLMWIPRIPEEILSAMYIRNIAMESEKEILEIAEKVEQEKVRHYKSYWTLIEKSKAYLQSFFK